MKFLIDHADMEQIKRIYAIYPVDGVTTNPSILAAGMKQPYEALREIRAFIGADADLHVQAVANTVAGICADADRIRAEVGEQTYIKVPATAVGLAAMKKLKKKGARITATAIYAPLQAFLAAKAGADFVAPYVNRMDNLGVNGIQMTKTMQDILDKNRLKTQILAASFKNSQQVLELCEYGIGAATIAPDVIDGLIRNDCVEQAVCAFVKDFESLCGKGVTMKDAH